LGGARRIRVRGVGDGSAADGNLRARARSVRNAGARHEVFDEGGSSSATRGREELVADLVRPRGRHSLWLRLRRYLIVFDPLTFVLDR